MRRFNLRFHFMVSNLLLAGVFAMPVVCSATEILPDGAALAVPSVSAEQWSGQERPQRSGEVQRSGETVVTLPGLLAVMQEVVQQPDRSVVLHYPEGEQGEVWVEELRDWLVALGLPSNRIQVMPGSTGDMINITQVATMQNPADGQNTTLLSPIMSSPVVEPFQIKEAADAANGVEIP